MDLLIAADGLDEARGLVGEPMKADVAMKVARAFETAKRAGDAAELWRKLIEESRGEIETSLREGKGLGGSRGRSSQWTNGLAGLGRTDAEALVGLLEGWRTLATGDSVAQLDRMRAEHLFKLGRKEEAAGLAMALLEHEDHYENALEMLVTNDPERGEAVLRGELERDPNDAFSHMRLLTLLQQQERGEEFEAMLDACIAQGVRGAMPLLLEMGDSLPLERLEQMASDPRFAMHATPQLVERYAGEERWTEAAQAYDSMVQTLERGGVFDHLPGPPDALFEQDRGRVWAWAQRLEMSSSTNDEVWGDIGDLWARLGETERARQSWQRALELDPQDGEWIGNLRRLRRQAR